jgi:hypothetical protein
VQTEEELHLPQPGDVEHSHPNHAEIMARLDQIERKLAPLAEFGEMLDAFKSSPMGKMMIAKGAKQTPAAVTNFGDR